ncbi:ATP-dependent protease La Type I [Bathymodiolus thermophilus thioautotrophic gill symbiont]|uniref:Lon protease n=1 Tax=Bathymodiolus thermophilus thioautotrophic gill symbiont TaxID=2360 RepID=A0A1J5U8G0_9GAMM|nr:endopeptidase La [Bathymodiolus thermophilus thioautotrophic gill symbiont]OIR24665.1 endopeptidase La [Bathymodiolus thermophilus thioautotrophic gill symbiont]CAB5503343.1 ATP-dependent protease La (EC Type I [Bathymodiolus thermophilus thioautotrophic gill symbiont]CAB5503594.1 ATP-dependent protease La (EC Type I [Bathymodiolus thermophilus thioautotrophic gill symbiont]SGZ95997.1 ATP-dependent protease La Type I [Bathymodiolus thermophilus thioautotrophic gill symbiont]
MGTEDTVSAINLNQELVPLLPLRDVVVFPHTVMPLFIGRESSVNAITQAMGTNKYIFLVAQKDEKTEEPKNQDLHTVGTLATILQMLKLPDGTIKVLVEGVKRAEIEEFIEADGYTEVKVSELTLKIGENVEVEAMMRLALENFESYIKLNKKIPEEVLNMLKDVSDVERFSDIIIANLTLKTAEKQELLSSSDTQTRLDKILSAIQGEIDVLGTEKKIQSRVRKQMESNQRDYYLNEQMKSIQKELGQAEDENEIEDLQEKINKAKMPKDAKKQAEGELKKLSRMSSHSSDASIIRTYIENLCDMPWKKQTHINKNLAKAQKILDDDHYGLDKVKERILEHLAVQTRVTHNKANILCLVGPPGVGKTSLGESIAKAVNRKYVRMALGGVRDEAEIRGHRRTYIGAMPGSIIQKMQKVKVKNPLFLLDEIDKMASDYRGDPSSAMLEVLDPEQNHTFSDHYIEVDYDLSQVMFVATANSLDLPQPLLDRMEIIELSGYTEDEKVQIAKCHLIKKSMKNNGISTDEIAFEDSAILDIVRYYTREAGVRNLSRTLGTICRKVVKEVVLKKRKTKAIISDKTLEKYLGVHKHRFGLAEENNQVGEVTGLAWTSVGGDLLTIEAAIYKGKGKLNYTGQLGDVMKESIQAAMSVTRTRAKELKIANDFQEKLDIHIHVPDGATPKDGPSAGAAMCTALVSVLTGRKVKADVAMTGEITLRGEITPIGGLKEKMLAALRGGIKTVIIPNDNERELSEVPEKIKGKLKVIKVKWIDEVLDIALEK